MNEHVIKDPTGKVVGKLFCEKVAWTESGDYESYAVSFAFIEQKSELRLHRGWTVERVK